MKIVITCGGTGGHFYPGLSLARFSGNGNAILMLSGKNSQEQGRIAEQYGFKTILLANMPGFSLRTLVKFSFGLLAGLCKAYRELRKISPDAVIGMGSFASLPVTLAAKLLRIPVFLHDGNARIGKANRWLSYLAVALGAGFPPVNASKCKCEIIDCGMPVRPELAAGCNMSKQEAVRKAAEKWGRTFDPERRILLIFGGSQGAAAINKLMPEVLKDFPDIQVVHLTGKGKKDDCAAVCKQFGVSPLLLESTPDMDILLSLADAVISRSGGSTIAELALYRKPAFLIPYPEAAEGHQSDNAACYASAGAGTVVEQSELTAAKVAEFLTLLRDEGKLAAMAEAAGRLARPNAAGDFIAAIAARIK